MKRVMPTLVLALSTSLVQADPVYHPPGSMLTYGAVSNGQTIMSDITNPAAGAAALKKNGNQYRFGIISSFGVGIEFGEVDGLYEEIEAQADAFDIDGILISNPADVANSVNSQVDAINNILSTIEDKGYARVFTSAHAPIMPLVVAHEALGGSLVLDINGSITAKAYGLQDDIIFDPTAVNTGILTDQTIGDVTINIGNNTLTVDNDSSYITKAAMTLELAMGYSRPFMETSDSTLYGGLRARYYKVDLSRVAFRMGDVTDAEKIFDDAQDADFSSDTGLGIDLGVLWVSENYRVGATFTNVNEPSFEYDPLDLSAYNLSRSVGQQLAQEDVYTMDRQLQLEAALYTGNQNWVLSAALDANAAHDPLGDEYQWATLSAAYATDSWFLPGFRVGYRSNLAGTEMRYITGGLTLFKSFNIDLAWSPDSVEIDGTTAPRGAILNLGFEATF